MSLAKGCQGVRLGAEGKTTLKATEAPKPMDIAWAAALYEGEGHCVKNGKSSTTAVVTQKDRWVIDRFQAMFGGRTFFRYARIYKWQVNGARARGFLMTIFKFLSPRRKEQLKVALGIF